MSRKWTEHIAEDAPVLYRAEARMYGYPDEFENIASAARVEIDHYYVVRETKYGYWAARAKYGPMHFIKHGAKKQFSWPTEREALKSLVARKQNEVWHMTRRLDEAESKLAAAEIALKDYQAKVREEAM